MRTFSSLRNLTFSTALALSLGCSAASPPDPAARPNAIDPAAAGTTTPPNATTPEPAATAEASLPRGAAVQPAIRREIVLTSRQDVEKLRGLTRIRDVLRVEHLRASALPEADQLRDFAALSELTEVGGLIVADTDTVVSLKGLEKLKVIDGNLDIRENVALTDADALAGLVNVRGMLAIGNAQTLVSVTKPDGTKVRSLLPKASNGVLKRLPFDSLVTAGSISIQRNEQLESVTFPALREIVKLGKEDAARLTPNDFQGLTLAWSPLMSKLSAPLLATVVGTLTIGRERRDNGTELGPRTNDALTTIDVPLLGVADAVHVYANPVLGALDMPSISYVDDYAVLNCPALTKITMGALAMAGRFSLTELATLSDLKLNNLVRVDSLELVHAPKIKNLLGFWHVRQVATSLLIMENEALEEIDLDFMTFVGSIEIVGNAALKNTDRLSHLTHVKSTLEVSGNRTLERVELRGLLDVGVLLIDQNGALQTLKFDALTLASDHIEVNGEPALTTVSFAKLGTVGGGPASTGSVTLDTRGVVVPTMTFGALTSVRGSLSLNPAPRFAAFGALRSIGGDLIIEGPVARTAVDAFLSQLTSKPANVVAPAIH